MKGEIEDGSSFPCPLCEYKGKAQGYLSVHINYRHTLEKFFNCDEPNCHFEGRRKADVDLHKRKHSDEKPFACSFQSCEYRCKRKENLSSHLRTHSEERRYKCELCPFRGKTRAVVAQHLKSIHSDLRPFKCTEPECGYAAKRKQDLKHHLLIHKGEKKYKCSFPQCGYRSFTQHVVNHHEYLVHSEEKKEKCRICDYTCKTKGTLTIHTRTHTKETPFICKEKSSGCEYRAKQATHLKRHEKRYHPHSSIVSSLNGGSRNQLDLKFQES